MNYMLKESLKVLWLVLLKSVFNEVLMTYLIDNMKEWRNNILLVLKDNIDEGDKLWTTMASPKSGSNGITVDNFNWNYGGILLWISDSSITFLSKNKMIGVVDYFKLWE